MLTTDEILQDRYRVVRPLGRGGFGAVYLATDLRLGRPVAVKEMDVARLSGEERRAAAQLFEREALTLAGLDHAGLTHIWDYFQQAGRAFLVMEYLPGQTLRDLLQRAGPLPEPLVVECAVQLCAVLAYLHARRPPVIFRDLKPANVMLVTPSGGQDSDALALPARELVFKLIDFGIARVFKPDQTSDTLIIGTPGYAPPEQYGQGQTDARSDIYALGATMHHLLSGTPPAALLLPPLVDVAPGVSPALADLVARTTAHAPADRYQSADALRNALLALHSPMSAAPPPRPRPAPRTPPPPAHTPVPAAPRQHAWLPPLLLVLVIVGALALAGAAISAVTRTPASTPQAGVPSVPPPDAATTAPEPNVPTEREWLLEGAPGRIAFGQQNAQGGYDLLVASLDGAAPQPFVSGNTSPAWSPDGQLIATTRAFEEGIVVGTLDEPGSRLVSPAGARARYPAWSPDGTQLAFAIRSGGSPWQLAIADLTGGSIRTLELEGVAWIDWSPDGPLAYSAAAGSAGVQDIFALSTRDQVRNLTDTPDENEEFPEWSPDGRQIVFVSSPPGQQGLPQRQLFMINADGSNRRQLTTQPGPHTNPTWSPDGTWIAYLSQAGSNDWQVWAMRADGSSARQLTFGPQRKFYLAWGG